MTRQASTALLAAALAAGALAACGGGSNRVSSAPSSPPPAGAGSASSVVAAPATSAQPGAPTGGLDPHVLAINKACVAEVQSKGDQGNAANTANFKTCLASHGIAPPASDHSSSAVKDCIARAAGDVHRLLACGNSVSAR